MSTVSLKKELNRHLEGCEKVYWVIVENIALLLPEDLNPTHVQFNVFWFAIQRIARETRGQDGKGEFQQDKIDWTKVVGLAADIKTLTAPTK